MYFKQKCHIVIHMSTKGARKKKVGFLTDVSSKVNFSKNKKDMLGMFLNERIWQSYFVKFLQVYLLKSFS